MTQEEFVSLMKLEKVFSDDTAELPPSGKSAVFDLESTSTNDRFFLDIDRRGRIELLRYKIQNRYARTKLPLVRIDINGSTHTNPDGHRISRNHIHVYKETEDDTGNLPWAYELDELDGFDFESLEFMEIFDSFCSYCNIRINNLQGVL